MRKSKTLDATEYRNWLTQLLETPDSVGAGVADYLEEFCIPILDSIDSQGIASPDYLMKIHNATEWLADPIRRAKFLTLLSLSEHQDNFMFERERQAYANHFAVVLKQQHDDLCQWQDSVAAKLEQHIAELETKLALVTEPAK